MLFPDTLENPTSISKREEMPLPEVVSTPRREDTCGQPRTSEDTEPELVDADPSRTSTEKRRTGTEPELKPLQKSRHEQRSESV